MKKSIVYFDQPGKVNTVDVLEIVKENLNLADVKYLVIASTTGETAMKAVEILGDTGVEIICVGEHTGFWGEDIQKFSGEMKKKLESKGVKVLITSHSLSGVGRSISNKFKGTSGVEIIAHTLRMMGGEGIKVAVEISIMAADSGLIPTDQEIIAVGGTHGGCDSAVILKAAHMNNFFDLEIREILAKPRQRTLK